MGSFVEQRPKKHATMAGRAHVDVNERRLRPVYGQYCWLFNKICDLIFRFCIQWTDPTHSLA